MYIASTIQSLTKSTGDVPVLMLVLTTHESVIRSGKFVARPTHYADLVSTARHTFNLASDSTPIFATQTLDVCRGRLVEIDESAYASMAMYLDEVTISLASDAVAEQKGVTPAKDSASTTKTQDEPLLPTIGLFGAKGSVNRERTDEPMGVNEPKNQSVQWKVSPALYSRRRLPSVSKPESRTKPTDQAKYTQSAPDDDSPLVSTTHLCRPKPRLVRDSWLKDKPETNENVPRKQKSKGRESYVPVSAVNTAQLPRASSRPSIDIGNTNIATWWGISRDEGHFTVTIERPYGGRTATIWTGGRHSVRSVLAYACEEFTLVPECTRILLMVEEDGVETVYYCDPMEAMKTCGVLPGSRLVLDFEVV